MLFNSFEFLIFLPVVFLLYWFVFKSLKWQNLFIVAVSYLFYGWWDARFLILIAFTTFCSFGSGILLEKKEGDRNLQKWISVANILLNLLILAIFKYYNFFAENLTQLFLTFGLQLDWVTLDILLPVGISFYTFQALSYTIDVYQHKMKPTHDIVAFFAFISFFPQLVAGPIERATHLLPQFLRSRSFDYAKATDGMRQILWGLFKKLVIADNCAVAVNQIFENYYQHDGLTLFYGAVLFTFQIYGDFSGYSDIAIGTARLFGINLMRNFNFPYFSRDIAEFWRRWHISLSSWLRDYLYISLGGNRHGKFRQYLNLIITMFLGGLWHGASWNFVLWGMFHGVALALHKAWMTIIGRKKGEESHGVRRFLGVIITFNFVCFCWIFFRNADIHNSMDMLGQIFTTFRPQLFPQLLEGYWRVFALMALGFLLHFAPDSWENAVCRGVIRLPFLGKALLMVAMIYLVIQMKSSEIQPFIYFQF